MIESRHSNALSSPFHPTACLAGQTTSIKPSWWAQGAGSLQPTPPTRCCGLLWRESGGKEWVWKAHEGYHSPEVWLVSLPSVRRGDWLIAAAGQRVTQAAGGRLINVLSQLTCMVDGTVKPLGIYRKKLHPDWCKKNTKCSLVKEHSWAVALSS